MRAPTKEVDIKLPPVKSADDGEEPEVPCWWERAAWSMGSGLGALAVAYLQAGLVLGAAMCYERPHLFDEFGLATAVFFAAIAAGIVGLVTGAIYPGWLGVGKMIVAHCVFLTILSVWIFPSGGGYAMHTPFLLLAALLEGAIASAVIRAAADAPPSVKATVALREKPDVEKKPWLENNDPRWWERVLWSLGCGLTAPLFGYLLASICWGVLWLPGIGWDSLSVIYFWFWEICLVALVAMNLGTLYPGRTAVIWTSLAHSIGCVVYSGCVAILVPRGMIFLPHFLVAAAVFAGLAWSVAAMWNGEAIGQAQGQVEDKTEKYG